MTEQISKPWEQVADQSYFRQVLGNVVSLGFGPNRSEAAHVRFGLTGIGYAPNYQIEAPDGQKHCFRGMGHAETQEVDEEFAPNNLSVERFSFGDVQRMLGRLAGNAR